MGGKLTERFVKIWMHETRSLIGHEVVHIVAGWLSFIKETENLPRIDIGSMLQTLVRKT